MPLPRLLAKINKRVFNPRQARNDKWVVVIHEGRKSGRVYETPVARLRDGNSYLFVLMYGTESDWVRNVLAAGKAELRDGSKTHTVTNPRLVPEEEFWSRVPSGVKPPPGFMNVHDFLELEIAE